MESLTVWGDSQICNRLEFFANQGISSSTEHLMRQRRAAEMSGTRKISWKFSLKLRQAIGKASNSACDQIIGKIWHLFWTWIENWKSFCLFQRPRHYNPPSWSTMPCFNVIYFCLKWYENQPGPINSMTKTKEKGPKKLWIRFLQKISFLKKKFLHVNQDEETFFCSNLIPIPWEKFLTICPK